MEDETNEPLELSYVDRVGSLERITKGELAPPRGYVEFALCVTCFESFPYQLFPGQYREIASLHTVFT